MRSFTATALAFLLVACSCSTVKPQAPHLSQPVPESTFESGTNHISVFAVLADPERFDGRTVEVVGFVSINSEGPLCILAPDLLSLDNLIVPNFINLDLSSCRHKERLQADRAPAVCSLTGIIDARNRGPFNHPPMACTLKVEECGSAVPIRRIQR